MAVTPNASLWASPTAAVTMCVDLAVSVSGHRDVSPSASTQWPLRSIPDSCQRLPNPPVTSRVRSSESAQPCLHFSFKLCLKL